MLLPFFRICYGPKDYRFQTDRRTDIRTLWIIEDLSILKNSLILYKECIKSKCGLIQNFSPVPCLDELGDGGVGQQFVTIGIDEF